MPFFKKTVWILFLHHAVGGLNSGQSDKILFDTGFRLQMAGCITA
ncbi:MAG: hypothetical protein ABIJ35_09355 [Acidobacteriota bacterium]